MKMQMTGHLTSLQMTGHIVWVNVETKKTSKRSWTEWKGRRRSLRWKTPCWPSSMSLTSHNDKQSKPNFRFWFSNVNLNGASVHWICECVNSQVKRRILEQRHEEESIRMESDILKIKVTNKPVISQVHILHLGRHGCLGSWTGSFGVRDWRGGCEQFWRGSSFTLKVFFSADIRTP